MKTHFLLLLLSISFYSCNSNSGKPVETDNTALQKEVQMYLDEYSNTYQLLSLESSEAEWKSNTMIIEGDSTNAMESQKLREAYAKFTGSTENITKSKKYLEQKNRLSDLQVKQLNGILYRAANNPATIEALVKERIKAETEQTEKLFGFDFKINGKSVTANDIDGALNNEHDLGKRLKAWESSKEVGIGLKEGLVKLRDLRNNTVKELGYSDFFNYQVSDYGMTTAEMTALLAKLNDELSPLYRELHTYY